jgi:mercuric ion binding protein
MKFNKVITALALAAVLFTSCKDTSKDGTIEGTPADSTATDTTMVKETAANLEKTSFTIDGMTCPMGCAATIESKLSKLDGVQEAKVDYEKKTATISFDASKQTPETLVETVEKIADGAYKVSDVKSSGDKAYYVPQQEPVKKATTTKKTTTKAEKKACCAADAKKSHDGKSCCAADKKASAEKKGGSL